MKTIFGLSVIFLWMNEAAAVTHSLQYFYTASSGIPNFPEFLTVGMVDGQAFTYYDSNIKEEIPKQDWIAKTEGPEYWDSQTQTSIGAEQVFKSNIDVAKQRFNQTGGAHVFQKMYGCEWDDETGEVTAFHQFGYDGEDFIALDLKTETWIAPTPQAVITKHKWEANKEHLRQKPYYTQICPEWLKKYVDYGRSSLMRTVLPSVSFLQKKSSSPISCHATGFYPNRAELVWMKDGEEIHEGVEKSEILPNHDGTFQMTAEMDFSSVPADEWEKYKCVFQLSGMNEDVVTRLDKTKIRTNEKTLTAMIIAIVAAVVLLVVVAGIGLFVYKKKTAKQQPSPVNSKEVLEELNPAGNA